MISVVLLVALAAYASACPFASMLKKGVNNAGAPLSAEQLKKIHAHLDNGHSLRKRQSGDKPDPNNIEQEFVLRSRVKTPNSAVFNLGFPVGYSVDGIETPEIDLIAGRTYKFTVFSACNHPFYITTDSRGKGRAPENAGFDVPPVQSEPPICLGESILWRPTEDLIGKELYYQCTVHDNMGNRVNIRKETLCEKYTEELGNAAIDPIANSNELVSAIVDQVLSAVLDSAVLIEYFDGTLGFPDFTTDNVAALALKNSLVSFFGDAFQCRDGSIPPYEGKSMAEAHKNMPITKFEYDAFNDAVRAGLGGFFEEADIDGVIDLLNSNEVRGVICNTDPTCIETLCNKYSSAKFPGNPNGDTELVTAIVSESVTRILADPKLLPFFNGVTPAGSVDFTTDTARFNALAGNLTAFFGKPGVLTCTQPTFKQNDAYAIADLKETHQFMPITTEIFDLFNDKVQEAAISLGVSTEDAAAIRAVLDSTEPLICNQPGCSTVPVADQQFVLTVKAKTQEGANAHHFANKGFPAAFQIDGADVEGLKLEVGKTYQFKVTSGCLHPFYFSTGTGAGTPDYEGDIDPQGQPICNGKVVTFKPTADDVGKTIFYACRNHNFMGGAICVVQPGDTTTVCNVQADDVAKTFCDEMTDNVLAAVAGTANNQLTDSKSILEKVVVDLFGAAITAPGDALLKKYFDGSQPAGSTDYINDLASQQALVDGLVKFFGSTLGCSDNSIESVAIDEVPNMKTVHQFMDIQKPEFDLFNAALLGLLQDVGGSGAGLSADTAKKVSVFLNSTATDICAGCDGYVAPSLCEKWAAAAGANQVQLVQGAVVAVFTKIVTKPDGLSTDLFDGTVPCESRDFISNKLNQANLVKTLVAYFGQPNVLGCTDSNFPRYLGEQDMELVHKNMPIDQSMFDQFRDALVDHLRSNLPANLVPSIEADIEAVKDLFASNAVRVICNQDNCAAPKGKFVAKSDCDVPVVPGTTTAPAPEPQTTTEADTEEPGTDPESEQEEDDGDDEDDAPEPEANVDADGAAALSLAAAAALAAAALRA